MRLPVGASTRMQYLASGLPSGRPPGPVRGLAESGEAMTMPKTMAILVCHVVSPQAGNAGVPLYNNISGKGFFGGQIGLFGSNLIPARSEHVEGGPKARPIEGRRSRAERLTRGAPGYWAARPRTSNLFTPAGKS